MGGRGDRYDNALKVLRGSWSITAYTHTHERYYIPVGHQLLVFSTPHIVTDQEECLIRFHYFASAATNIHSLCLDEERG